MDDEVISAIDYFIQIKLIMDFRACFIVHVGKVNVEFRVLTSKSRTREENTLTFSLKWPHISCNHKAETSEDTTSSIIFAVAKLKCDSICSFVKSLLLKF